MYFHLYLLVEIKTILSICYPCKTLACKDRSMLNFSFLVDPAWSLLPVLLASAVIMDPKTNIHSNPYTCNTPARTNRYMLNLSFSVDPAWSPLPLVLASLRVSGESFLFLISKGGLLRVQKNYSKYLIGFCLTSHFFSRPSLIDKRMSIVFLLFDTS